MASEPTRGALRAITRPEAKRHLSCLVDDLARHVDYLHEEGVTEVACALNFPSASQPKPIMPVKVAQPQPKQNIEHPTSNIEHRMKKNDTVMVSDADADVSMELKAIAQKVAVCKKCGLHAKRHQAVPGQGHLHPDILFIGEGPGEDEDKQGLAFVGRAGQMLTRLITRMGYTRDEVFIANIVKCRPPNNRKPMPEEMEACLPFLKAQIAVLKPKVIVTLGATALEGLIPTQGKIFITRMRGKWLSYEDIPLMPTFHPSYLLRNQSAMWDVWNDMQEVLKHLGRTPPPAPAKGK